MYFDCVIDVVFEFVENFVIGYCFLVVVVELVLVCDFVGGSVVV